MRFAQLCRNCGRRCAVAASQALSFLVGAIANGNYNRIVPPDFNGDYNADYIAISNPMAVFCIGTTVARTRRILTVGSWIGPDRPVSFVSDKFRSCLSSATSVGRL